MARAIDADRLADGLKLHRQPTDQKHEADRQWAVCYNAGLDRALYSIAYAPTLTQPNEWVKVMEAINNAAVAYIEGGPYDNDLPGMEFALKIDRLSRDFVRPPVGEEEEKHVIEITENF